jgi:tripartite-type tricarboxylate transporter receptor subunit TctC
MKRSTLVLCLSIFMCLAATLTLTSQAKAYPDRPIDLIVPLPPGSAMDTAARMLAEELGKILGVEVVIVNKPGASLTVGTGRQKQEGRIYPCLHGRLWHCLFSRHKSRHGALRPG